MAIRNLTDWNDPLFRKASRPVLKYDERLRTLLDDMRDTLEKAGGYGCAAVHIGVLRRIVVILEGDTPLELVNPVIAQQSGAQDVLEGSIAPNAPFGFVRRPQSVTVQCYDRNGAESEVMGEGFLAATLCHEIDHLDGILFADKASRLVTDPKEISEYLRRRRG